MWKWLNSYSYQIQSLMHDIAYIVLTSQSDPDSRDKSDFDWWSKYYYSIGDTRRTQKSYVEKGYDRMVIYPGELETAFNGFTDVAQMFPLYRGKGWKDRKEKSGQPVGYFKGSFKVYSQPNGDTAAMKFSNLPSTDPVEVIVRVYVIKVIQCHVYIPYGGKLWRGFNLANWWFCGKSPNLKPANIISYTIALCGSAHDCQILN